MNTQVVKRGDSDATLQPYMGHELGPSREQSAGGFSKGQEEQIASRHIGSQVHSTDLNGYNGSFGQNESINGHSGSMAMHSASVNGGHIGSGGHSPNAFGGELPSATASVEEHFPVEVKGAGVSGAIPPITVVWTTVPLQNAPTFDHEPSVIQGYLPPNRHELIAAGHPLPLPINCNLSAQGHQQPSSQHDCKWIAPGHQQLSSQHDYNLLAAGHKLVSPMTFRFYKDPPVERQGTDPSAFQFGTRGVPDAKLGTAGSIDTSSIEAQIQEMVAVQKRFREELDEIKTLANSNTHDLGIWKRSRRTEEPTTKPLGPPSREPTTQSSVGRSFASQTGKSNNGKPVANSMGNMQNGPGNPGPETLGMPSLTARRVHGLHRAARTTGVSFGNRWFPSGRLLSNRKTARDEGDDEDFCLCIR